VDLEQHDSVLGEEVVLDAPHDSSERSTTTPHSTAEATTSEKKYCGEVDWMATTA
jgi:hypothetical protein